VTIGDADSYLFWHMLTRWLVFNNCFLENFTVNLLISRKHKDERNIMPKLKFYKKKILSFVLSNEEKKFFILCWLNQWQRSMTKMLTPSSKITSSFQICMCQFFVICNLFTKLNGSITRIWGGRGGGKKISLLSSSSGALKTLS